MSSMNPSNDRRTIQVECKDCGGRRNHWLLFEEFRDVIDPYGQPCERNYHRLVECKGCESIKYVSSTQDFRYDHWDDEEEEDIRVYPDAPGVREGWRSTIDAFQSINHQKRASIPGPVMKMYQETVTARNSNILTLAGGGLRAVVEAICIDKNIVDGNLHQKIETLASQNLLTNAQAQLLHEERYLGNNALHEMSTPSVSDIEDGLEIVEGLMNTIYILPVKAERMKNRREIKSKPPVEDDEDE